MADKNFPMFFVNTTTEEEYVNFNFDKSEAHLNRVAMNGKDHRGDFTIPLPPKLTTRVDLWSENTPLFTTFIGSFSMGKQGDKGTVNMTIHTGNDASLSLVQVGPDDKPRILYNCRRAWSDKVYPNEYLITLANSQEPLPPLKYGSPTVSIIFAPKYGVHGQNYVLEIEDEVEGKLTKIPSYGLHNGFKLTHSITPIIVFGASGWANNFNCKIRNLDNNAIVDEFTMSYLCWEGVDSLGTSGNVGGSAKIKGGKMVEVKGGLDRSTGQGQKVSWPGHGTIAVYYK